MLRLLTIAVNFVGLVVAIWLGLYVVTRSRRSLIAWLTGLTLWSLAGLFLNVLLALNPPPNPAQLSSWLRIFFPFWPVQTLKYNATGWLQGWSVAPSLAFWHHATTLMRPGHLTAWRWTRILVAYVLAGAVVAIQTFTPVLFVIEGGDPLYLNTLHAGPWYGFFAAALLVFSAASVINLTRSASVAGSPILHQQLVTLMTATLVAGLTGPISIAGSALGLPVPMLAVSLPLTLAVGLIGYGVARYSALSEGRILQRDFAYNGLAVGMVTLLYLGLSWFIGSIYTLPAGVFIFVIIAAIVSHSFVDLGRLALDKLFYRHHTRQLRASLRRLSHLASQQEDLSESLSITLETLCSPVRATYGMLFIFEKDGPRLAASYHWHEGEVPITVSSLSADDFTHLEARHFPPPLDEAALLIPLYSEAEQVGALVLGRPVNGLRYSNQDLDQLFEPSDQLAVAIQDARQVAAYLAQVAQGVEARKPVHVYPADGIPIEEVEHALRNLYDYAALADSPLIGLGLVQANLPPGPLTHLERGKALCQVLCTALEKLRPSPIDPKGPIPREWYAYLILRDAYLEDLSNREIMARLYISEGTFNRTRRGAIRAVRRALSEMEAALH